MEQHKSLRVLGSQFRLVRIGFLNHLFFSMTGAISQDRESCQFLFCLMKNPLLYRSARPESGREGRERFFMEPLARTQSERRRRLALASGFRLVRSFGIDRIAAPARAVGRGSTGPDG